MGHCIRCLNMRLHGGVIDNNQFYKAHEVFAYPGYLVACLLLYTT